MWIRPSMPSRSTKAPKSTMFEIWPSTTSPGLRRSRICCRCSLRSSSSTARRESTTLLRERLSSITFARSSWPRNSSRSWTRRISTSEAGRKPRTPRSRIRPPLTTSITFPTTGSPDSAAPSIALPRELEARALLGEDQPAFGVLLREHERVDLFADLYLVLGVDRAANRELGDRDHAFRLVADVDENLVLVDADDRAVDDLALVDRREGGVVVRDELAFWAGRPERGVVEVRRRRLRLYGLGFWVYCVVRQSGGQYSLGGSGSIWRFGPGSRARRRGSRRAARRSSDGPRLERRGARSPRFRRGGRGPPAGSSSGRTRRR